MRGRLCVYMCITFYLTTFFLFVSKFHIDN